MQRLFAFWMLLTAGAVWTSGCSGGARHAPTYPATGVVTYRGQPVDGAVVTFISPGAPRYAMGKTDAQGKFSLTTYEPDDGAFAGTHTVLVVKKPTRAPAAEAAAAPEAPVKPADIDRAMMQQAREAQKAKNARSLLPEKYANEATSDLKFQVVEGENTFEIALKD